MIRPLELLAPARDAAVGREAILHGADAVYIGGPSHGARAAAANSIEDIASLVDFAHSYDARVYVTVNTIVYDSEISAVERTIADLYRIGVDALIVQDMGILRMDIPPIALHASTQCDTRDAAKARFLAEVGFSQIVLARELSLEEIRCVRAAVPADIPLEAFVHGALCVSYSGDCQASCATMGRSANRGECAQMCRMAYDLVDDDGRVLIAGKHLLSLRDLCRLDDIEALALAGVSSFKIEGRLKDAAYVKNTVAAYRAAVDSVIAAHPDMFCRASLGVSDVTFTSAVEKSFNRGFTRYFLDGCPTSPVKMASPDTPKSIGEPVGTVVSCRGDRITAKLSADLANGDGLGYFDADGAFDGFRLNRIDGNVLSVNSRTPLRIPAGTVLYRNSDIRREAMLAKPTARRSIPIALSLAAAGSNISLTLRILERDGEIFATEVLPIALSQAKTPQQQARRRALDKFGDTVFSVADYRDDVPDDVFIPASALTALRRSAVEALMATLRIRHRYDYRRTENGEAALPQGNALTYHDNVSNRLAEQFYREHGATSIEPAMETSPARVKNRPTTVMTTRYCLRRELGACLREKNPVIEPYKKLFLRNGAATFALGFDCAACRMTLSTVPRR